MAWVDPGLGSLLVFAFPLFFNGDGLEDAIERPIACLSAMQAHDENRTLKLHTRVGDREEAVIRDRLFHN